MKRTICVANVSNFKHFTDTLKQQAFAAQTSLERLDLRDNRITTIESGAFDGLNQPKEIYLSGNRLSKMNSDVFQVCNIAQCD